MTPPAFSVAENSPARALAATVKTPKHSGTAGLNLNIRRSSSSKDIIASRNGKA